MWNFFEVVTGDTKYAKCTICAAKISRGSVIPKSQTTAGLKKHLETKHLEAWTKVVSTKKESEKRKKEEIEGEELQILNLRSKKLREAVKENTIPFWAAPTSKLEFHSVEAQKIHKIIFEHLIMDLLPFTHVNNPGFIRHHAQIMPRFEVASSKYYRNQLNPVFQKVKSRLMDIINEDNPKSICVMLDAWSAQHHGYMGVNITYLCQWKRKHYNICCSPFDQSHTAVNIYQSVVSSLEEWNLASRVKVVLRDNASNESIFTRRLFLG